jgi:hypothetical protein
MWFYFFFSFLNFDIFSPNIWSERVSVIEIFFYRRADSLYRRRHHCCIATDDACRTAVGSRALKGADCRMAPDIADTVLLCGQQIHICSKSTNMITADECKGHL